jgi:hypothetical protein
VVKKLAKVEISETVRRGRRFVAPRPGATLLHLVKKRLDNIFFLFYVGSDSSRKINYNYMMTVCSLTLQVAVRCDIGAPSPKDVVGSPTCAVLVKVVGLGSFRRC